MKAIKINDYKNSKIHDFEVIKRVIGGEKGLYEILMRRNNQKLFRVIRSYIKNDSLIKDIMQNTYIKAYEKLYQFSEKSEFSTWLIRIGINEALREIRSNKSQLIKHPNSLTNKDIIKISDSNNVNPENAMIQKEAKWVLEKAIDELPSKYKTAYILKEVEGMRIAEICDCLNISNSNVKVRIHRSKQILKEKLYELSQASKAFEFGHSRCDNLVEKVMSLI